MATLRAATTNGIVTLNTISGILTRSATYQGRVGRGKGLKIKQAKWPFSQASKQASKCKANHEAESSKVAPELCREVPADLILILP